MYYMLIMVCQEGTQKLLEHAGNTEGGVAWRRPLDEYEPRTAARQCALLQELLQYGFSGDLRAALDECEVLLRRYSSLSGCDSLKVALVQRGMKDDALKTHLVLHASRVANFQLVREQVRSVLLTQRALLAKDPCQWTSALSMRRARAKARTKARTRTSAWRKTSKTPR